MYMWKFLLLNKTEKKKRIPWRKRLGMQGTEALREHMYVRVCLWVCEYGGNNNTQRQHSEMA